MTYKLPEVMDSSSGDLDTNLGNIEIPAIINLLNITNVQINDTANYTCFKQESNGIEEENVIVQTIIPPRIAAHSSPVTRTKVSTSVQFYCLVEAHPMSQYQKLIQWGKLDDDGAQQFWNKIPSHPLTNRTQITAVNETFVNVTLDTDNVSKKDNGTYICSVQSPYTDDIKKVDLALLVLDLPQVSIDYVKAVGAGKIFLNWTINDGNDPIKEYYVQYRKDDATGLTYYNHAINAKNMSYVLDNFDSNSSYEIRMLAKNSIGTGPGHTYPHKVKTLIADPIFIPRISVKGNTHTTITIGWSPPPSELLEYIHCYELIVAKAGENSSVHETSTHPQNSRNLPYMFDNLQTATEYKFRVRSCSELTKLCGNWSEEVTGTTMDGTSSEPLNLKVSCMYYNISGRTTISANWDPPAQPNGNITTYQIVLDGLSTFRSAQGPLKNETYGPKVKSIDEKLQKADYENVPPNTNYTVRVAGVTRSKRPGEAAVATCTMPPTVPENIGHISWDKYETDNGNGGFKLTLPQVSERNGPICGYRIYLVRKRDRHLLPPENIEIMTYHEVHAANNTRSGAYIAEILSAESYQPKVFLGDEKRIKINETQLNSIQNEACRKLLNGFYLKQVQAKATTTPMPIEGTTGKYD